MNGHFINQNVPNYPHLKSHELREKFLNEFNENEKRSLIQAVLDEDKRLADFEGKFDWFSRTIPEAKQYLA